MRSLAALFVALAAMVAFALAGSPGKSGRRDPRFFTLGELARELADDEKTFDAVVQKLGGDFAPLGGAERAVLMRMFRAHDWDGLDKEPVLTLDQLGQGLALLAQHRGTQVVTDVASAGREPLGIPVPLSSAPPSSEPYLSELGFAGLAHGDRIDRDKQKRAADGKRLADVLERLAVSHGQLTIDVGEESVSDAASLMRALVKSGHVIVVVDQRLAANFGDLERNGIAIATPLWVKTGRGELALPVPHAQLVLVVRGPQVNADVTLYPSLNLTGVGGGGTHFRADDTADQPWCGGVIAHRYEGEQAIEAVRLMALMRNVIGGRVVDKNLPLDGYFALGVCTLAPALVEQALTGATTVWPLTHDPALFDGATEIDELAKKLPHDGRGAPPPTDARIRGAVPWPTLTDVPFPDARARLAPFLAQSSSSLGGTL